MLIYKVTINDSVVEFSTYNDATIFAQANNINESNIQSEDRVIADPLLDEKKARCLSVDAKTQQLIRQGFIFDDKRFSLSVNAQVNWLGLKTLADMMAFPVTCTTHDDEVYMLTQDNLNAFVGTAAYAVKASLGGGQILKMQINAAEDQETLDAIQDER